MVRKSCALFQLIGTIQKIQSDKPPHEIVQDANQITVSPIEISKIRENGKWLRKLRTGTSPTRVHRLVFHIVMRLARGIRKCFGQRRTRLLYVIRIESINKGTKPGNQHCAPPREMGFVMSSITWQHLHQTIVDFNEMGLRQTLIIKARTQSN